MKINHFYFLSPQYFIDFPSPTLMQDHNNGKDGLHSRPCFYAFTNDNIVFWLIPISSKVAKFERIYRHKVQRYGKCDTIEFGYILGHKRAFLIQNMCPVTPKYILNEYLDHNCNSVAIDHISAKRIITKAKKVLSLQKQGYNLIYGDVLSTEKKLFESSLCIP